MNDETCDWCSKTPGTLVTVKILKKKHPYDGLAEYIDCGCKTGKPMTVQVLNMGKFHGEIIAVLPEWVDFLC